MEMVAICDLRNNTAQVIQKVRGGQTVELDSRGEPVARILPIENQRRPYLTPAEIMSISKADRGLRKDLLMGDVGADPVKAGVLHV